MGSARRTTGILLGMVALAAAYLTAAPGHALQCAYSYDGRDGLAPGEATAACLARFDEMAADEYQPVRALRDYMRTADDPSTFTGDTAALKGRASTETLAPMAPNDRAIGDGRANLALLLSLCVLAAFGFRSRPGTIVTVTASVIIFAVAFATYGGIMGGFELDGFGGLFAALTLGAYQPPVEVWGATALLPVGLAWRIALAAVALLFLVYLVLSIFGRRARAGKG
ncbi:MAG: hypothetical protein GC152_15640 [Alphaproteobacteria bacterium]|nr:hypothetical protein [Alphaproteobacteria bacterium]